MTSISWWLRNLYLPFKFFLLGSKFIQPTSYVIAQISHVQKQTLDLFPNMFVLVVVMTPPSTHCSYLKPANWSNFSLDSRLEPASPGSSSHIPYLLYIYYTICYIYYKPIYYIVCVYILYLPITHTHTHNPLVSTSHYNFPKYTMITLLFFQILSSWSYQSSLFLYTSCHFSGSSQNLEWNPNSLT